MLAADALEVGLLSAVFAAEALGIWAIVDAARFPVADWETADLSKTGSIVLMFLVPVTALYYFLAMRRDLQLAAAKRVASDAPG